MRAGPSQHSWGHHFDDRVGDGRQAESINGQAVAMLLHGTPFHADPAFAATLNVGIGIDFRVRGGTYFGDIFSIDFGGEQKQLRVRVVARQTAERFQEIRWDRLMRVVRTTIIIV